jgi:hypothetical protein
MCLQDNIPNSILNSDVDDHGMLFELEQLAIPIQAMPRTSSLSQTGVSKTHLDMAPRTCELCVNM